MRVLADRVRLNHRRNRISVLAHDTPRHQFFGFFRYPRIDFLESTAALTLLAGRTGRPPRSVQLPLADRAKRTFTVDRTGVDLRSDVSRLAGLAGFDSKE